SNRDGRLGVRELRSAWASLAAYDRDGDGFISRTEIPRQFQVTVSQGPPNYYVAYNPSLGIPGYAAAPRPSEKGPLWFRKMDRNGDGDVSPREFLGSPEDFKKIDADGDGLISAEEAERADAWMRKKTTPKP